MADVMKEVTENKIETPSVTVTRSQKLALIVGKIMTIIEMKEQTGPYLPWL